MKHIWSDFTIYTSSRSGPLAHILERILKSVLINKVGMQN